MFSSVEELPDFFTFTGVDPMRLMLMPGPKRLFE